MFAILIIIAIMAFNIAVTFAIEGFAAFIIMAFIAFIIKAFIIETSTVEAFIAIVVIIGLLRSNCCCFNWNKLDFITTIRDS